MNETKKQTAAHIDKHTGGQHEWISWTHCAAGFAWLAAIYLHAEYGSLFNLWVDLYLNCYSFFHMNEKIAAVKPLAFWYTMGRQFKQQNQIHLGPIAV